MSLIRSPASLTHFVDDGRQAYRKKQYSPQLTPVDCVPYSTVSSAHIHQCITPKSSG